MRVVLDINVLVSGLISPHGPPGQLLLAWKAGKFVLVTSDDQLSHTAEVLRRPKLARYAVTLNGDQLLADIATYGVVVTPRLDLTASPDPEDNLILGAAVAGNADYLVTGDKSHLLSLHEVEGVKIISAATAMLLF